MLFSQRKGFKLTRVELQKENIDDALRTKLWNILFMFIYKDSPYDPGSGSFPASDLYVLFMMYWHNYFKFPIDTLSPRFTPMLEKVREYFFSCQGYEVFDFIEFTVKYYKDKAILDLEENLNVALEQEYSAFRLVEGLFTEINSQTEIESIEKCLEDTSPYANIREHLETALALLSNRKTPNFRNSIKESISAVEAMVKKVTNNDKATLGEALKEIEKDGKLHPAFKSAMSQLYGYTSAAGGIRHALMDEDDLTFVDAKYMLVICTAFINYLLGKMAQK
jgi:uncharacterized protein with PIN domain